MLKIKYLAFFCTALLMSCNQNITYTEFVSLPNGWSKSQPIMFHFEQTDTLSLKNFFIMIRNNEAYDFSNLFLITKMEMPDNKAVIDTLEYEMATPEGKWLGYGYSGVKESKLFYKENFKFPRKGKYHIKIEQAMRKIGQNDGVFVLEGITEVGVQVENSSKENN